MITHTPLTNLFIRLSILALRYAPLLELTLLVSLLIIYSFYRPQQQPLIILIPLTLTAALLTAETLYFLTLYRPHKQRLTQTLAQHPTPPLTPPERKALFEKCIRNVQDWNHYLSLWFLNRTPPSQLTRGAVREFLLWAFFDRDSSVVTGEEEAELDGYIFCVESLSGYHFRNDSENVGGAKAAAAARSLRLTVDPVRICYRSVLWYGIVTLTDCITHFHLWRAGFVHHRPSSAKPPATPNRSSPQLNGEQPVSSAATATTKKTPLSSLFHSFPPRLAHTHHMRTKSPSGEIGYYYRPHKSLSKLPVVFIHGIGIGLWPYREFLSELLNEQEDGEQVGILALEILPFSTRLTSPPLSRARSLEEIQGILAQQGPDWKEFVLVTHSYGSVLATHILHSPELKPRVKGLVMVDPVTVLLHLPDVAYNFTRRPPRRANEWQLWYFASMDVGVAEGLGRHFFWRENIIWREELQQIGTDTQGNVAICLSGRDLIVDTHTVARYLASEGDLGSDETNNGLVNVAKYAPARGGNHLAPSGLEILWYPDLDHAQIFESQRDRRHVIEVVSRYCQRSRSRNVDL